MLVPVKASGVITVLLVIDDLNKCFNAFLIILLAA